MIVMALGGRCAEEIFFNRITTGASDDIKKCTGIAQGLVTQYGMSEKLGTLSYSVEEGYQKAFSDKTNRTIDEEVKRVIDECYEQSKSLLTDKKELVGKLAEELLKKETLSLPEIVDILGPRPYPLKETVLEYLRELRDRKDDEPEKPKDP